MADSTYRAGIIGLGLIGGADPVSGEVLGQKVSDMNGTHAEALRGNSRVGLVAGSSRDLGRRERFEARTGVGSTYADWGEMLKKEPLDIVSVATYAPVHAEIGIACAEHGVRVIYCEKPVATRLPDAERLLAACEKAGALLVINHNRRFNPNYRKLRDLIVQGGLGELTSAMLQWGSGRLGNVGTHMFDTICMLTGQKVEAVSGALDLAGRPDCRGAQFQDPGGWGMLRLTGGVVVTVDAADYGRVPPVIAVNGTEGRATVRGSEVTVERWDGNEEVWPDPEKVKTSMDNAVEEIVAWLDGGFTFPYDARDAVHTMEAIVAFHSSHAHDAAWASLPLRGEERDWEVLSG
ncbi:MAG: Gfo/Idh/MocA family oxidoreductase [bacterium]|nr:Gfo/Idh/MocA family oxidoreductase [bacterium]